MTMTPQEQTLQTIDPSDEETRPGSLDVEWAERAFQTPLPAQQQFAVRRVAPARHLSAWGRVLAGASLAACLVITAASAAGTGVRPRQASPAAAHAPALLRAQPAAQPAAQPGGSGPSILFRCGPASPSTRPASSPVLSSLPSCSGVEGPAVYR